MKKNLFLALVITVGFLLFLNITVAAWGYGWGREWITFTKGGPAPVITVWGNGVPNADDDCITSKQVKEIEKASTEKKPWSEAQVYVYLKRANHATFRDVKFDSAGRIVAYSAGWLSCGSGIPRYRVATFKRGSNNRFFLTGNFRNINWT